MANRSLRFAARGSTRSPACATRNDARSSAFQRSSFLTKNAMFGSNMRLFSTVSMWKHRTCFSSTAPMRLQECVRAERLWSKYESESRMACGV
jgi:hypothetical protein